MSDFFIPHITRTATKQHKCTYCAESINTGDQYVFQKGNWEGAWFETKMHPECFDDMVEYGDGEYTMYSNERPKIEEGVTK